MPWWLGYLNLAELWHIPPWKLFEGWSNREFWMETAAIKAAAQAEADRLKAAQNQKH